MPLATQSSTRCLLAAAPLHTRPTSASRIGRSRVSDTALRAAEPSRPGRSSVSSGAARNDPTRPDPTRRANKSLLWRRSEGEARRVNRANDEGEMRFACAGGAVGWRLRRRPLRSLRFAHAFPSSRRHFLLILRPPAPHRFALFFFWARFCCARHGL